MEKKLGRDPNSGSRPRLAAQALPTMLESSCVLLKIRGLRFERPGGSMNIEANRAVLDCSLVRERRDRLPAFLLAFS